MRTAIRLCRVSALLSLIVAIGIAGCNGDPESPGITALIETGGVCEQDGQCSSGLCVGSICTDNAAPTAQFAKSPLVTIVGVAADVSVVATDADDDPLVITWELGLTPAGAAPSLVANDVDATLTPDKVGIYRLDVTVADELSSTTVSLLVIVLDSDGNLKQADGSECSDGSQCTSGRCEAGQCSPNNAPTAEAGATRTVDVGATVTLDGSGSSDADGDALSYQWQLVQLPEGSAASLSTGTGVAVTFVPDVAGLYVAALWVNDGFITSQPDTLAVVAVTSGGTKLPDGSPCESDDVCSSGFCFAGTCKTNEPPTAGSCGVTDVEIGVAVDLNGSGASDPEGQSLTYSWTMDQAPNGSTATIAAPSAVQTTFTPDAAGTYLVRLVVNDGLIDSLPAVCVFTASDSSLKENGQPCGSDAECTSGFCHLGLCADNQPPTAVIDAPADAVVGADVALDGSGSSDPEGAVVGHTWSLVNQPANSTATLSNSDLTQASLTPDAVGAYVVGLVVSDGIADSAMAIWVIEVAVAPDSKPNGSPCTADVECTSGYCSPSSAQCACRAKSCEELGAVCGTPDNGCGEALLCGSCTGVSACNPSTFQCDCTPQTCNEVNAECGAPDDGCGTALNCGGCADPSNGNGSGSCSDVDFTCGYACNAGFHVCGTECLPDASPNSCGTSCTPCPPPPSGNGISACDVTDYTCDVVCDTGFDPCDGDCIDPMTDSNHCGGCGVDTCQYQCVDGLCVVPLTLEYVSGDGQTAAPNSPLAAAIRVRVTDPLAVPQSGVTVVVTPSPGAAGSTSATTNSQGIADVTLWTGRDAGDYSYGLTTTPVSNTVQVNATAVTPGDGIVIPIVNVGQTSGTTSAGAGSQSGLPSGSSRGLITAAADGTVYFSSDYRIWELSPQGELSVVAGTGLPQETGDFGPALEAGVGTLSDLALDETNGQLYLFNTSSRRIRYVDLNTGNIEPYAGGGSAGAPGYGNGGPATLAAFPGFYRMIVHPDTGDLYVTDLSTVRFINRQSQIIDEHPLSPTNVDGCAGDFSLWTSAASVAFSQDGTMFVGGQFCGGDAAGVFSGVIRLNADGTRSRVAGGFGGTTAINIPAREHSFSLLKGIFFDTGDNLYVLDTLPALRRIDAGTTIITAVMGTGTSGSTGNYGPAVDALLKSPQDVAYASAINRIIMDDHGSFSIREIWAGANTARTELTLRKSTELQAIGGGDGQTGVPSTDIYEPLGVYATDAAQTEISGLSVEWTAQQPGATPQATTAVTTPPSNNAIINGRIALKAMDYTFTASLFDLHGEHVIDSPQTFTVSSSEPAAGTLISLLNPDLTDGTLIAGPSLATQAPLCSSAVEGPAGSIFAACGKQIIHITEDLTVTIIAGSTSGGSAGDGGPASGATFSGQWDLAYDSFGDLLYIADASNGRVRMIDFNTTPAQIFTVAGGVTTNPPNDGDGLVATEAVLRQPRGLALSPDGGILYITEESRIRQVDLTTQIISSIVSTESGETCTNTDFIVWACGATGCGAAVDPLTGEVYFSGLFCGTGLPNDTQPRHAIIRYAPDTQALTFVAGDSAAGTDGDGVVPESTKFSNYLTDLAVDGDGNLFVSETLANRVRYVDLNGVVSTVAGTGTAGNSGNLGPATAAQLNQQLHLSIYGAGHLLIGDALNRSVRLLWR